MLVNQIVFEMLFDSIMVKDLLENLSYIASSLSPYNFSEHPLPNLSTVITEQYNKFCEVLSVVAQWFENLVEGEKKYTETTKLIVPITVIYSSAVELIKVGVKGLVDSVKDFLGVSNPGNTKTGKLKGPKSKTKKKGFVRFIERLIKKFIKRFINSYRPGTSIVKDVICLTICILVTLCIPPFS